MKILKEIKVPTGEIYTAKGDKGVLEFLTVADYGKDANIKADFLGITRELNGVPNGTPMPLTEKWVITISTQYACSSAATALLYRTDGVAQKAVKRNVAWRTLAEYPS